VAKIQKMTPEEKAEQASNLERLRRTAQRARDELERQREAAAARKK
jgi:hypothetical protein